MAGGNQKFHRKTSSGFAESSARPAKMENHHKITIPQPWNNQEDHVISNITI